MKKIILALLVAVSLSASAQDTVPEVSNYVLDSATAVALSIKQDTSYAVFFVAECHGCPIVAKAGYHYGGKTMLRDGKKYAPPKPWEIIAGYINCSKESVWFKK